MINKILQFLIYQFTLVKKIVDSLLINIKQIRFLPNKIILFLSLALSACDSGCIDAASLGTEDAVSVSLGANPTVSIATIVSTDNSSSCNNTLKPSDNPTDFVAFGSGDACNINADVAYSYLSVYDSNDNDTYSDDNGTENDDYCYTFWKKLNIQYDSNFDYAIGISGSIEQCSSETTWPDSLDFILSASAIDGTNLSFVNYNVDDEVSKIDALDIGKNDYNDFNASITPTLSPYDCENDKVIFYSNMGTNYNNSKIYNVDYGNDASDIDYYSCSSADFLNATSGCGNPLALTNIKNEGDDLANEVSAKRL